MLTFKNATHWVGIDNVNLYLVDTMEDWKTMLAWLTDQSILAADTETNGFLYYMHNRVIGMSFGWEDHHFYVPVRHVESCLGGKPGRQLDMDDIREDVKLLFSRPNVTCVGHNFRFDQHFYRADGIEVLCRVEDTMLKWALHDENAPAALKDICSGWKDLLGRMHKGIVGKAAKEGEKEISEWRAAEASARRKVFTQIVTKRARELACDIQYQGLKLTDLKKIAKEELKDHPYYESKKEDIHYGYVPIEMMAKYAAMDTYLTYRVYMYLAKQKKFDEPKLKALYENELELSAALLDLEENGMKCDRKYLEEKCREYAIKIDEKRELLENTLGMINMNSSAQLLTALQAQGCVFTAKTDSGAYSTDKKALTKLAKDYDIVKELLLYRAMIKLKNTYFDGILSKMTPDDYCHTSFNQNVRTGRMSSRSPNFTNMPRGNLVRDIFICPEDYIYILADYSQIEIRITAHYSRDPLLLEAYKLGQDVHTRTMSEVFGIDYDLAVEILKDKKHPRYEEVSSLRTVCKIVNFGVIYGVTPAGLSQQIPRPAKYINFSEDEWISVCEQYVEDYFLKYQGVKRFVDKYSYLAKKQGYVETHFGRVRHLPEVNAVTILGDRQKYWMEKKAQRQGVNSMIQGCQDPNAPVLTVNGYIPINKLEENGKPALVTYTGTESNYTVMNTGVKECVEVETSISTGVCSTEHKFYVYDKSFNDFTFKSINELKVNDYVATSLKEVSSKAQAMCSIEESELMGVLIGDGSYGKVKGMCGSRKNTLLRNVMTIAFNDANHGIEYREHVKSLFSVAFPGVNTHSAKYSNKGTCVLRIENKEVRDRFQELGLEKVSGKDKVIPSWMLTQPQNIQVAFIRGLFDTDGGLKGGSIGLTSQCESIVRDTQSMLLGLGIKSRYEVTYDKVYSKNYFRIVVDTSSLEKWASLIKPAIPYKTEHALRYASETRGFTNQKYTICPVLREETCAFISKNWESSKFTRLERASVHERNIRKDRLLSYLLRLDKSPQRDHFEYLLNHEFAVIRKITPVPSMETMDLELHGEDHSYICRGLVQHNTSADLFKVSLVRINKLLKDGNYKTRLVNTVHDEVQFYLHKDEKHLLPKIRACMEDFDFAVPIVADFSYSKTSWAQKSDLK